MAYTDVRPSLPVAGYRKATAESRLGWAEPVFIWPQQSRCPMSPAAAAGRTRPCSLRSATRRLVTAPSRPQHRRSSGHLSATGCLLTASRFLTAPGTKGHLRHNPAPTRPPPHPKGLTGLSTPTARSRAPSEISQHNHWSLRSRLNEIRATHRHGVTRQDVGMGGSPACRLAGARQGSWYEREL